METTETSSSSFISKYKLKGKNGHDPYTLLSFFEIDKLAKDFADLIEGRQKDLIDILLTYESYEVALDEISRSLDLLRNLKENEKYFKVRVGGVTSFLPRNQPLYALSCFVIVPSLMSSEVHFRIPHSMRHFFSKMLALLEISKLFPNIVVSAKQRIEFIQDRSALLVNPKTKENRPVTDVVIFTGRPSHADKLRLIFDKRTLFITNGAGHNPVIVSEDADLSKAVEAVVTLQLYNQGQDCAAPNSILVHSLVLSKFLNKLRGSIRAVKVGEYENRSCRVGPISDPEDLVRIQNFLVENHEWLDPSAPGVIRTGQAIVEPTIISKPLAVGGNFNEIFAPVVFVQEYDEDSKLSLYIEDKHYARSAMYITLYGTSNYIKNLIGKKFSGKVLHDKYSYIHNTHLHAPGIERGTQPYGGSGYGASSISINGKISPMATLPQRDIYKLLVEPLVRKKTVELNKDTFKHFTTIEKKDVEKLLRIQSNKEGSQDLAEKTAGSIYFDTHLIKGKSARYVKIKEGETCDLLKTQNIEYIVTLKKEDVRLVEELKKLLRRKSKLSLNEFTTLLYAIPKIPKSSDTENLVHQKLFFKNIYQLLFGKKSGPKLGSFLWDAEDVEIIKLLGV